jgi:gamma-glutamyltranspeptidase/glutathione hydrolase/leukotriene-C4 hydrolase
MGIGGGFFMLHYSRKDEKITVLDARETAPLLSTADMFNTHSKTKGGLSIAVPGELKGYWKAHQMFGQAKWSRLFQPAIEMCNNGFALPASQAKFLKYCEPKILDSQSLRETFVNRVNNQLFCANSIIRRPKLAKTLEVIGKEGASAFYDGSLTDTILEEITSNGGIITKADLQSYECVVREPVTYKLRSDIELNSAPSPSCGLLLNFILAIMDGSLFKIFLFFFFKFKSRFLKLYRL